GFGLCGGFPPTINGQVISPLFPDAGLTSGAVKVDLLAAFLSITPPAGPPAAGSLGGATNLPAGTTLGDIAGNPYVLGDNYFTAGVYDSLTSIVVTGDLTFDAQGDPDAVFVMQSFSTIDTADGAPTPGVHTRILLVGGAKASNIYWQAGTSATLGLYSEFQGNILASASITMKTGASSCGRLLAGAFTAGAFVFDTNIVSVPGNVNAPASCK
ncbi:MAG: ice-binding family protein, partial [Deltaproteobacteria bacterium]|nr:ice-binding family protein [Deltaproteobacteria bacterium]